MRKRSNADITFVKQSSISNFSTTSTYMAATESSTAYRRNTSFLIRCFFIINFDFSQSLHWQLAYITWNRLGENGFFAISLEIKLFYQIFSSAGPWLQPWLNCSQCSRMPYSWWKWTRSRLVFTHFSFFSPTHSFSTLWCVYFQKYRLSGSLNARRVTEGVVRTTIASVMISMGYCFAVFAFWLKLTALIYKQRKKANWFQSELG